nr:site-specific integrase [Prochloraceae cyanobacterium]
HLIRLEDYPKSKKPLPRYIPEEVIKQLNQYIDKLPEQIMRIVLVLQECGLRIGEVLTLSFDCLRQDTQGDWFLFITRHKMKKEQNIPISRELVAVIQEQQQYIKDNLDKDFDYLFCGRQRGGIGNNKFLPEPKVMTPEPVSIYLNRLAKEENITDSNGKIWRFQSHQFRHTVGTRMINNNVPQHIVQKYLGHESPTMTMRYAHIHDQTLKKEIAQFHDSRVVNVAGNIVETINKELDSNLDLHLIKKNVLAQALPNGSCARPIQLGECPHANACLTCGDFRTTTEFLEQHKTQLEETKKIVKKAEQKGWQRQAEMNKRVANNLEKIIKTLESEDKEIVSGGEED